MATLAFYLLASLIFLNAGALTLAFIPRVFDHRYRFTALISLALAISTFTAFLSANWSILMAGFGIYCLGLILDCLFFSGKSFKLKYPFIGIYSIAAIGTFAAFFVSSKILFLVTYLGYWLASFLLNKGYLNGTIWSGKGNKQ